MTVKDLVKQLDRPKIVKGPADPNIRMNGFLEASRIYAEKFVELDKGYHDLLEAKNAQLAQVTELTKELDVAISNLHPSFRKSFAEVTLQKDGQYFSLVKAEDGFTYLGGYVSDAGLDRDGDRMSTRALESMKTAINGGMALFMNHDHGPLDTLGAFVPGSARIDGKGLYAEARLEDPESNPNVKSLLSKLEAGVPLGLSVGGDMAGSKTVKEADEEGNPRTVREISDVKLYEVSVVGLPSNPRARITGVR